MSILLSVLLSLFRLLWYCLILLPIGLGALLDLCDDERAFLVNNGNIPVSLVNALQVSAEVSTLSEWFAAEVAYVGPLLCVLAKMIPQIAALAEDRHAALVLASIVELEPVAFLVPDLKNLILVCSYSFELFVRKLLFDAFQDDRLSFCLKILLWYLVLFLLGLIDLMYSLISCLNGANCVHGRIQILYHWQSRQSPLRPIYGHLIRDGLLISELVRLGTVYNFLFFHSVDFCL